MRPRNLVIFILFLLIAAAVVLGQFVFHWQLPGAATPPAADIEISVIYASELKAWLDPQVLAFNAKGVKVGNAKVHVTLEQMDEGDAMQAIVRGQKTPAAWIPASTLYVNLLNAQWREGHQSDLLLRSGEYQATPLVLTAMVFVMWEERASVFTQKYGSVDWDTIQQAVTQPGGWPAIGGDASWGPIKFGMTDPTRSNSGLQALALASYSYHKKTSDLTTQDVDNTAYIEWLRGLRKGIYQLSDSSANQMRDMILLGPSAFDVVAIYENLAAEQVKNAQGRWGSNLRVFYPALNNFSDHPFSILVGEDTSAEQKDAALALEDYLYSPDVQMTALHYGWRPANPDVPVLTDDPENLFNKHKDIGLEAKIGRTTLVPPPTGEVLTQLQGLFARLP